LALGLSRKAPKRFSGDSLQDIVESSLTGLSHSRLMKLYEICVSVNEYEPKVLNLDGLLRFLQTACSLYDSTVKIARCYDSLMWPLNSSQVIGSPKYLSDRYGRIIELSDLVGPIYSKAVVNVHHWCVFEGSMLKMSVANVVRRIEPNYDGLRYWQLEESAQLPFREKKGTRSQAVDFVWVSLIDEPVVNVVFLHYYLTDFIAPRIDKMGGELYDMVVRFHGGGSFAACVMDTCVLGQHVRELTLHDAYYDEVD